MNVVGLSPEHESNLRRLAAYLLGEELQAEFDMDDFSKNYDIEETNCGSAGCAIGHGPYAGIPKRGNELWVEYSDRALMSREVRTDTKCWYWCFSGDWKHTDNTPIGAARRILWMLGNGVPDEWQGQMYGNAPLCYEDFEITPEMLDWQAIK